MKTYEEALVFRAGIVSSLAKNHPELCDESGVGFWPVSVMTPSIFARCLYLMEQECLCRIINFDYVARDLLVSIRTRLTSLVYEGDMGEDHACIYLEEHPKVKNVRIQDGLFYSAYKTILDHDNWAVILGFIYSLEVGSLASIKALVDNKIIVNGEFAKVHLVEEVEHAKLAIEIRELIINSEYWNYFVSGCELHDNLYTQIGS